MRKSVAAASIATVIIIAAVGAFAAGYIPGTHPAQKRTAKEAVAGLLKDPWSARWQNVRIVDVEGVRWACGEVNAKNGNGAYAGWQRWRFAPKGSVEFPADPADLNMTSASLDSDDRSLDLRAKYLPADEAEVKSYIADVVALRDRRIAFVEVLKKQRDFEKFWQENCAA